MSKVVFVFFNYNLIKTGKLVVWSTCCVLLFRNLYFWYDDPYTYSKLCVNENSKHRLLYVLTDLHRQSYPLLLEIIITYDTYLHLKFLGSDTSPNVPIWVYPLFMGIKKLPWSGRFFSTYWFWLKYSQIIHHVFPKKVWRAPIKILIKILIATVIWLLRLLWYDFNEIQKV